MIVIPLLIKILVLVLSIASKWPSHLRALWVDLKKGVCHGFKYNCFCVCRGSECTPDRNKILITWLKGWDFFFFFWLGFTPCKAEKLLRGMELQEKKHKKDYRIQKTCLERTYSENMFPDFNLVRKETVDIDILVTSRNGDRKIMQFIRITIRPPLRERKWNQLSHFWRASTK